MTDEAKPTIKMAWADREARFWWDDFGRFWAVVAATNALRNNLRVAFASDDPEVHEAVAFEVATMLMMPLAREAEAQFDPKTSAMLGRRSL